MKKLLASLLALLVVFSYLPAAVYAASPNLSVTFKSANDSSNASYTDFTALTTGSKVYFLTSITNTEPGTTATNVRLHVDLPTNSQNNHTISATVTADGLPTQTATNRVTISNSAGLFSYINSTTLLVWDNGTYQYNSIIQDAVTTDTINFGSLIDGTSHTIQLIFQANAYEKAISGSTTSGGGSAGGPCSDSKAQNIGLTTVTRVSPTAVKLVWTKGDATNFIINYGLTSGKYIYATTTTGTEVTINDLDPKAKYFFAVLPLKGCNPGNLSNEGSVDPIGLINTANVGVSNLVQGVSSNLKSDTTINPYATAKPAFKGAPAIESSKSATPPAGGSAKPKGSSSPISIPLTKGAKVMIGLGVLALLGAAGLIMRSATPTQSVKRGRGRPRKSR